MREVGDEGKKAKVGEGEEREFFFLSEGSQGPSSQFFSKDFFLLALELVGKKNPVVLELTEKKKVGPTRF